MQVTIDRAGRIVVPKPLRDALGLDPETPLEMELVDDHIEISNRGETARIIEGPNGPVIAATGKTLTRGDIRAILEATRERR
ncbi:MAG: AbrB/MazE/SpoVT family DNA-binding domain-containing protein [Solirubrobacteraceae bacterium]